MVNRFPKHRAPAPYPEPTVVVGVGRVGLAVLESLGQDWAGLQRLQPHGALRNLRLVHVTARSCDADEDIAGDGEACWRAQEAPVRAVVLGMGDGDLPSLALDFTLLRTLGFIRFIDGVYELARPTDCGLLHDVPEEASSVFDPRLARPQRARTIEWVKLSADPLVAVEQVAQERRDNGAMDRLLGRLLFRMRAGHSPRAILATITRVRAMEAARDPMPWQWAAKPEVAYGDALTCEIPVPLGDGVTANGESLLEGKPLRGHIPHDGAGRVAQSFLVPRMNVPQPTDLPTPFATMHAALLEEDVCDFFPASSEAEKRAVNVVPARDVWQGFYDHDSVNWYVDSHKHTVVERPLTRKVTHFETRLRILGRLSRQGLVRLWDDLQKQQKRKRTVDRDDRDRSVVLGQAVSQCIELLGDAIVRHEIAKEPAEHQPGPSDAVAANTQEPRGLIRADLLRPENLAFEPSEMLHGLKWRDVDQSRAEDGLEALRERLRELGLNVEKSPPSANWPILRQVRLSAEDVRADLSLADEQAAHPPADGAPDPKNPADGEPESQGLEALRMCVAGVARELFDFDQLRAWRHSPTRRSPRLVVYVVGELSEPFVRASVSTVIRMLHASLARALEPIFVEHRVGLDRSLHIVPILCLPNPSDSRGAGPLAQSRVDEALILEALHVVRRKLEVAPGGTSCVSQIYLHGRVTDNAVNSLGRCIKSTRDFITLFSRNVLEHDRGPDGAYATGLDRYFSARTQHDLFATFTCSLAELPRAHLRNYGANRLARTLVRVLEDGAATGSPACVWVEPPHREQVRGVLETGTGEAIDGVDDECRTSGDRVASAATGGAGPIDRATHGDEVARAYERNQPEIERVAVSREWQQLVHESAPMNKAAERLRAEVARLTAEHAVEAKRVTDQWMTVSLTAGDPVRAIERGFEEAVQRYDDAALTDARACQAQREQCNACGVPDPRRLASTRQSIIDAARAKPSFSAMKLMLALWALMASVLGAPISHAIALGLHLDQEPRGLEFVLGPLAPLVGIVLLWPLVFVLLRRLMQRRVDELQEAIDAHGAAARALFFASQRTLPGSARAFLTSRLDLLRTNAAFSHVATLRTVMAADRRNVRRVVGSVVALRHRLTAQAERLGVRVLHPSTPESFAVEDTKRVLDTRGLEAGSWLLQSTDLAQLYTEWHLAPGDEVQQAKAVLQSLRSYETAPRGDALRADVPHVSREWAQRMAATMELKRWREEAWMSDDAAVVEACATAFDRQDILEWPSARRRINQELERFILSHYPNFGFSMRFRGFEGLDEDSTSAPADAKLLISDNLASTEQVKAYARPDRTLANDADRPAVDIEALHLDMEMACFLSLARDVQVEAFRSLRRFDNHFERARPPEDRLFPFTHGGFRRGSSVPVTLTGSNRDFVEATRGFDAESARAEDAAQAAKAALAAADVPTQQTATPEPQASIVTAPGVEEPRAAAKSKRRGPRAGSDPVAGGRS